MPAQLRSEIFPARFARFSPTAKYTVASLQSDAPKIVKAVLGMGNVTNVDVQAVHAGIADPASFPMVSMKVLEKHGGAMFVAVVPNTTPPNPTYKIKATKFRCNNETGADWTGSDEPYWIFGSLGSGITVTTRSQIFGNVDTGESRSFAAGEGCIWGQNGAAQDFPEGAIGTLISLWEHDYGDPNRIQACVGAAFAAAATVLAATGVATWVAAVVAGVGAAIHWLLQYIDEDHIADQTFVFSRQTVVSQLAKTGQYFDVSRRFADGDGDYTLTLRVSRAS